MVWTLDTAIAEISGIGEQKAKALSRLGLHTVGDLLRHFPRGYEDRTRWYGIPDAPSGEAVCVTAMVAGPVRVSHIRKGLKLSKVLVVDSRGSMDVTFFNRPYIGQSLNVGEEYVFFGVAEGTGLRRSMTNPVVEPAGKARFTGCIMPVYHLTAGISNNLLAGLARNAAQWCAQEVEECLPAALREEYGLADVAFSMRNLHFPENWEALELARRRVLFEELLCFSCGLALLRERRRDANGPVLAAVQEEAFFAGLPFALTDTQRRAVVELGRDLEDEHPMNRLLQGDVGSGKTVVAAYGLYRAAKNGFQSALMAPTEILAAQHFRTISALLSPMGIRVGLLTASMKAADKRAVRAALAEGALDVIVGTHAILSAQVAFSRLGLVVADEQHRFGVEQRAALVGKGEEKRRPHVLVMSATPIPRTLSLILYRDLDVTVLDGMPPGRKPVKTYLVGEEMRARIYRFIHRLTGEGRQVYIVCPMIEEGEEATASLKSVTAYERELRTRLFPDRSVALLHGRMKPQARQAVMEAFAAGETQILVSTTVIEVGVDVPNAVLMVVENAERFGLSQLHQLRGRVGRGADASYCILMSDSRSNESLERLKVLVRTGDGFAIAEEDLRQRGPGDVFGSRQHGLPLVKAADLAGDVRLLQQAQGAAEQLMIAHPGLEGAELAPLRARVDRMFAQAEGTLN